ncbi:sodium:proton exchanger [Alkalicaulis satelles]|uniref:Sodium:proton exchanger n=1 Tax=Alkalicaulis satelles TaxID=2609175 RepID=A0A5M6ZLC7_9PROT|nr:cation:proton antiporter [Alkalicaulis satelles]KAA5804544.1 sodium:proton exchanger [Alkalicaulis satelles]
MNELISESIFYEIAILLSVAAAIGLIGHMLRQPLIVSFIVVGIVAGPSVLDLIRSDESVGVLAQLGIALLLFLVGIKLDIKLIQSLGPVSLLTGLGQVIFTSFFGFFIALGLGFDPITSVYIAVALTFSSTIIIVKLLSDKREIDSLHGRIALGFLIVQDIVVVFAMIALSALGVGGQEDAGWQEVLMVLAAGVVMVVVVVLFIRFAATPLTAMLAGSPELLITFSIAMAAAFAAVGDMFGVGKELGGLLAGVALASTPYRDAISARLAPLRDFLLLFFFVALGSQLDLSLIGENIPAALVFSAFVLIGNPLIVMVIMGVMGYRKRTGFLAGLTVAQISEFSLIFMAMGLTIGHVSDQALGLVTLVGLITIGASTYMITYSHRLYPLLEPVLGIFERKQLQPAENGEADNAKGRYDVVLLGLGRYGGAIAQRLVKNDISALGADFNPSAVRTWRERGLDAIYGDLSDQEFLTHLPLRGVRWVISTATDRETGVALEDSRIAMIKTLRKFGYNGKIAVTSQHGTRMDELIEAGADLVLQPFQDAADRAVDLISGRSDLNIERLEPVEDAEEQKDIPE